MFKVGDTIFSNRSGVSYEIKDTDSTRYYLTFEIGNSESDYIDFSKDYVHRNFTLIKRKEESETQYEITWV